MTTTLTGTSGSLNTTLTAPVNGETADASSMATNVWQKLINNDVSINTTLAAKAPNTAPYVVITNTAGLTTERALTAGTGIKITDGGANSTVTLAINDNTVATVSGTIFTKVSGSLQCLGDGSAYMRAAPGVTVITGALGQVTVGIDDRKVATLSGSNFSGPVTGSAGFDCNNRRLANFCNRQSSNVTTSGGYTTDTIDTYTPTIASGAIGAVGCRFFGIDSLHNFSSAGVCDAKIYVTCPAAGDLRQIGTPVYDNALQSGSVPSLSCSAGSIVAKMSTYFTSSVACQWFFNNAVNLF